MTANTFIGKAHDFDFLIGQWQVANRRLQQRFAGCDQWDEFTATSQAWVMLDGAVSVDEIHFPARGFSGLTLRSLDSETGRWSIYWVNSETGRLFPPVHGGFEGDRGEFYGEDIDDGRAVQVRYLWNRSGDRSARWEQAFSLDGREWETNWVMAFSRVEGPVPAPSPRELAERYVAVWNEPDLESRRQRIAELWAEDGLHFTPSMEARGHEALARRVTGAWEKWVRDARHSFRSVGDAVGHHGGLKFHWEMVTPQGDVSSLGFDFLVLAADGRIEADYQFIEPVRMVANADRSLNNEPHP